MEPQNNPSNGPIFDGNTWLAIALTFGFFVFWQNYTKKHYPQEPSAKVEAVADKTPKSEETNFPKGQEQQEIASATQKKPTVIPDQTEPLLSKPENLIRLEFPDTASFDLTKDGMGLRNIVLNKYSDRNGESIAFHSKVDQWKKYFSSKVENEIADISPEVQKLESAPFFGTSISGHLLQFDVQKIEENVYRGEASFSGGKLTKTIEFNPKTYSAQVKIKVDWQDGASRPPIETHIFDTVKSEEASFMRPSYEGTDFFTLSEFDEVRERQVLGEKFSESYKNVSLTSVTSQYFALALLDNSDLMPSSESKLLGGSIGVASTKVIHGVGSNKESNIEYKIFFGPKDRDILVAVDPKLEKVIDYGFFGFIAKPILRLLKFLHSVLGNWGLAIILLTLAIRLLLLPIALSSMRSMKKMQKIQPKLKQIKEKFKDNPQQVNLETIALMKKEGANPISGCLPMFAQIPIFFALYSVLGVAIELYQSPFFLWIKDLSWQDPLYILPVVVTGLFFLQTRMSPSSMDENQKKMMTFMPLIFGVFMLSLPSGLMVYFLTNNIFGIGQQYYVNKEKHA